MQFQGIIQNVIFRNAENGYTVINMLSDGKIETAVGIFPPVSEGEEVIITGNRVINERFGEQIVCESVRTKPPTTPEGIIKYLSSDLFKGIGEKTAKRIVDKFGDKTFQVIETNPMALDDIQGITAAKALLIGEKFNELKSMQNAIIFLQQYDISLNLAMKIYKRYKAGTETVVSNNPYRLIYDIDGVGFFTADRIAIKTGLFSESPERVQAAVNYVLNAEAERGGNTYSPIDYLVKEVIRLLGFDETKADLIKEQIDELHTLGFAVKFEKNGVSAVMLRKFYQLEKDIAEKLVNIVNDFNEPVFNIDEEIEAFQTIENITLHKSQIEAINAAVNLGGVVITGGPGTGKTTIIKCIISIFKSMGIETALCTPTGRAAKRLSEATGEQAMTIHRLLDLDYKNGRGHFNYNEDTKLSAKAVIVDEVSMADEYVFNALINAIDTGGRLIIVGDKDQLPSVGAGNVLADIIASGVFTVKELTEIYRQESDSYIIINAHLINKGRMPLLDRKDKDFFFIEANSLNEILFNVTSLASVRLPGYLNITPDRVQVLCPMKRGLAGINNINRKLQAELNPNSLCEIEIGEDKFRKGDKVIQLNNNYQAVWNKENGESGEGIFNGDIGRIEEIDMKNFEMTVRFEDDRLVKYTMGDFDQLALAYAITIHKSQGSEFDAVIVAITPGSNIILTRNLLYTAITRAKRLVVLVGDRKTLEFMVNNNYTARRYTCLVDFIKELI